MDWKDLVPLIGKSAPLLGTLIGGPAGAAIGGLVASALGTSNDPDSISEAIANNPDALVKLKEVEATRAVRLEELSQQYAKALLEAETTRVQLDVEDRKSARSRESDTKDSWTPRLLALFITIGFFGVMGTLLFNGKPALGGDALMVMLGSLGTAWTGVVAYYFGSSASSQRKTELLSKAPPIVE